MLVLVLAGTACRQQAAPRLLEKTPSVEPEPSQPAKYLYFLDLQAFLPKQIPGFLQGRDEGSTGKYEALTVSEAERAFSMGEDRELVVRIVDTPKVEAMASAIQAFEQAPNREPNAKPFKLPSGTGYLRYDPAESKAEATLLVGERFAVSVTSRGFRGVEEVRRVAEGLDLPGLSKLR